jgi:adenylate cyclase
MGTEIERKFLVRGAAWKQGTGEPIAQGYLNRDKARTVRVRIKGERAYLTVKGETVGVTRSEFEYEIPVTDAQAMLAICDGPLIEKRRYVVEHAGLQWEIDEFEGESAGLIVAEVELVSETQSIELPDWVGEEVTHDPRYYNSNLSKHPYRRW